jgi:hypothetical protein
VAASTSTNSSIPQNNIRAIRIGTITNATVYVDGRIGLTGDIVPFEAHPSQVTFTVRRIEDVKPSLVSFVVVDACGDWPTFVGGGSGAF